MEKYTNKLLKYNPHNAKIMVQNKAKKKKKQIVATRKIYLMHRLWFNKNLNVLVNLTVMVGI